MMKFRVNPLAIILLFVVASSSLLYLLQKRQESHAAIDTSRQNFIGVAINGRLTYKSLRRGVQSIRVDNDTQTLHFKTTPTPDGAFFHVHAELGDSIIKLSGKQELVVKTRRNMVRYQALPAE